MDYEWDAKKNLANVGKHGFDFRLAAEVFESNTITIEDMRKDYGEKRLNTFGLWNSNIVVVITHTNRHGIIRIISFRRANKKERNIYYEYYKNE
ncbi:MAG: BrnT family toxin [Candidatus Margulisbacteria bacterium]|jgi:uncharacterized DUF497 family protein|nr:BrnT family toxin [Candidatus Margulisiibacteriota bacterium]